RLPRLREDPVRAGGGEASPAGHHQRRRAHSWLPGPLRLGCDRHRWANKQAVEEMRRRHDLPLRAADKTGKSDFIEIMNGEFIQGRIKLRGASCSQLAEEYAGLIWDER